MPEKQLILTNGPIRDDEVSLKDLILKIREWSTYLVSKWIIVLLFGFIGGVIGVAYAYSKQPIYKAELSFALEDDKEGNGLGGAFGLASQFGIDMGGSGGGAFSGDNLLLLMKSRSMVEKSLLRPITIGNKTQTLAETYIEFNNMRETWSGKSELKDVKFSPGIDRSSFTRQQDSILGSFSSDIVKNNLSVDKIDKKLSIISVKVNSSNELFSKSFAEVLVSEVSTFYVDTKTKKSVQNLAILQHQTDSVRRALNSAITGVASSIDVNPNANLAKQMLRVPSQRRQVDVQANQAILSELVKNLEISKVSLRKETPLIQVIDQPILPLEKTVVSKTGSFLTGLTLAIFLGVITLLFRRLVLLSIRESNLSTDR